MWNKPGNPVPIDASQLVVGLYIWLDMKWDEHAFMTSRILLKTPKEIAIIQSYNTAGRLFYYPEKSTAAPLLPHRLAPTPKADAAVEGAQALQSAENAAMKQELILLEKSKKDKLRLQKDSAARADLAWGKAARATREALLNLSRSPKVAGEQLAQLSRETATTIAQGEDILLHLLGDKKEQGPQFHALNTMTLCMLVGKKAGLNERELADLALGALAHDAGKAQIPLQILKASPRKKHEEDFYRQHVQFSTQFAAQSGAFSREALAVIADHHEAIDGSGWPQGKKDAATGARILSLVDRYDRLCSPEASSRESLMPAEALATMFRHQASQFDATFLRILIKLLGVYPPGTLVQLSDGSLALVVSPGAQSLQPKVLIYCPELSKDEAPTLELANEPGLKIVEAIRPASLPPDVLLWLNPQQRLSYFFSVADTKV
jgi:HD-GYP domain-containing protein (c-di-GMP phosphodiesterase class II)